jgi:hypothetical protein
MVNQNGWKGERAQRESTNPPANLGPVWLKRRTYRLTATLPLRHQILSLNLVLNGAVLCCLACYYEL